MNFRKFRSLLDTAQGRSEFAVVVFVDIRGFSNFSTNHDSIETAIFIKRFFQVLLDKYFSEANYAKPTGDGLLVIFNYAEKNLQEVSGKVLTAVLRLNAEYSGLFENDEMVNFPVPDRVGVGISRGTVCCLYSGKTIVDYSGKVLNLAARLMDMARPSGIVIDGRYQLKAIPEKYRGLFSEELVYVRGIQEDTPLNILYLTGNTTIPTILKTPILSESPEESICYIKFCDLIKLDGRFNMILKNEPKDPKSLIGRVSFPNPNLAGYYTTHYMKNVGYQRTAKEHRANFLISEVIKTITESDNIDDQTQLTLEIEYLPKRV